MTHVLSDIIVDPVERAIGCSSFGILLTVVGAVVCSMLIAGLIVLIVLLNKRKKRRENK